MMCVSYKNGEIGIEKGVRKKELNPHIYSYRQRFIGEENGRLGPWQCVGVRMTGRKIESVKPLVNPQPTEI